MKKVGIITFQRALNYGALLQMYALHKVIKEITPDVKVEVVDYFSPLCQKEATLKSIKGSTPLFSLVKKMNFLLKKYRFKSFCKGRINFSKKYTSQNISSVNVEYEMLVSGSDQVWNPEITLYDANYLLDFATSPKKISYAASIGINELNEKTKAFFQKPLEKFSSISVRENSAKSMVNSLLKKDVAQVHIDPTLLLTSVQWQEVFTLKPQKRKYVFVYQIKQSVKLLEIAKRFAKEHNLDVIYVGPYSRIKGIKYVPAPSVKNLLNLFACAEYIFENSFHGTVFSIQFNRRFYVDLPFNDGRNDRILDLLSICQLSNRLSLDNIDVPVNWENVKNKLQRERERSIAYLRCSLDL